MDASTAVDVGGNAMSNTAPASSVVNTWWSWLVAA